MNRLHPRFLSFGWRPQAQRAHAGPVSRDLSRYTATVVVGGLIIVALVELASAQTMSLAGSAAVYGIAALGLGLMWGQAGQVTVAQGAAVGIGAYVAALLQADHGLGLYVAVPLSLAAGGLFGLAVSVFALRLQGNYFVILTFAINSVMVALATRLTSLTGGISGVAAPIDGSFLGLSVGDSQDFTVVVSGFLLLATLAYMAIRRSRWGLRLRVLRENPSLAESLGGSAQVQRSLVLVVGSAYAGLAGALYTYLYRFIDPTLFAVNLSIYLMLMVLLGGRAYAFGPVVGAVIYTFLPRHISLSPIHTQIAFGLALVVLILTLPGGLLSLWRVLNGKRSARSSTEAAGSEAGTIQAEPKTALLSNSDIQ